MLLSVIGAGPAYTDRPGATGASYLVRADGSSLLLDLGQGSFARLAGLVDPATLDAVVISHLHPDHFIDLVPLRHYLRWERPPSPGQGHRSGRAGRRGSTPSTTTRASAPSSLDIEPLAEGSFDVGPFRVDVARVTHTEASFGFRVSRSSVRRRTGRVSSTRGTAAERRTSMPLVRPGRHAAVRGLVRARDRSPPGAKHLDGPTVGDLATRIGAGRVLLTHLQMGYDRDATVESVRRRFDGGPVELVDPGFETTIGG